MWVLTRNTYEKERKRRKRKRGEKGITTLGSDDDGRVKRLGLVAAHTLFLADVPLVAQPLPSVTPHESLHDTCSRRFRVTPSPPCVPHHLAHSCLSLPHTRRKLQPAAAGPCNKKQRSFFLVLLHTCKYIHHCSPVPDCFLSNFKIHLL